MVQTQGKSGNLNQSFRWQTWLNVHRNIRRLLKVFCTFNLRLASISLWHLRYWKLIEEKREKKEKKRSTLSPSSGSKSYFLAAIDSKPTSDLWANRGVLKTLLLHYQTSKHINGHISTFFYLNIFLYYYFSFATGPATATVIYLK